MKRILSLAAIAACGVVVAACGSSGSSSAPGTNSSSGSSTGAAAGGGGYGGGAPAKTTAKTTAGAGGGALALSAKESGGLSFSHKTLTAKAGTVTLTLDNPSSNALAHAIAVEGGGVDTSGKVASPGGASSVTVKLKPGTYTFYCPVPGHRQSGMQGTLTVG